MDNRKNDKNSLENGFFYKIGESWHYKRIDPDYNYGLSDIWADFKWFAKVIFYMILFGIIAGVIGTILWYLLLWLFS